MGLAWREVETVLVPAAEDGDAVRRVTERIEFAEEPGIVVTNRRSGVHTAAEHANAHTVRHIVVSIDLGSVGLEIGLRRRPV